MKYLLLLSVLVGSLQADRVITKTIACPNVAALQKTANIDMQDPLALEMYTIVNGCVVLAKDSDVEAIGYDPRNSKDLYQKIRDKKSGVEYYMPRSKLFVEQGGKKNTMRF